MTSIIIGGYEQGNFSIWRFYLARIRRVLPALLVVIFVLLTFGWFRLPPPEYMALGEQSVKSMLFLSNIYFWNFTDYFDNAAEDKWLLHTWSLAIEAQFYLIYPIFITLVWMRWKSLNVIAAFLLVIFITSISLNIVITDSEPLSAFYLLHTRIWELASGGLVYLISKQGWTDGTTKNYSYWLGWVILIVSFVFINENLSWPGYLAILPVLGSSLIILGNKEKCKFTQNSICQWIGDRSYSLYLWHWPVVVALYFINLEHEWVWVIIAISLSILLAHFSYQLVEVPTRKYLVRTKLLNELILIVVALIFLIGWAKIITVIELDDRIPTEALLAASEAKNYDVRSRECQLDLKGKPAKCVYGRSDIGVVFFGDSHALATITAMEKAAEKYGKGAMFWGLTSCPTIFDLRYDGSNNKTLQYRKRCARYLENGMQDLKAIPSNIPLISVSRTSAYILGPSEPDRYLEREQALASKYLKHNLSQITSTACKIQQTRQVYLMRPIPEMMVDVPKALSRKILFGLSFLDTKITVKDYHERNKLVWEAQDLAAKQCGVKILNPIPYLCDDNYCYGSKNGRPLYFDDDHLSEYGNKLLTPMFEQVFQ